MEGLAANGDAPSGPETRLVKQARMLVVSTFLILIFPWGGLAQIPAGGLQVVVQDATGARVPKAEIEIRAAESSLNRRVASDPYGQFRFPGLPPGLYQVTVSAGGFKSAQSNLTVTLNTNVQISATLQPEGIRQTVNVRGQGSSITAALLDTTSAVQQGIVTAKDLESIPLAHRSFANVAYLVPGTEPVEPSDPTKARITAVSFGGSSGLNDQLSVDGGDNSDDYIGGFLQNFSSDMIQEFAVTTAQAHADSGRTTGGAVVITTKRGGDQWHGNLSFYGRAAALNARFPIDNPPPDPKQPFSRQNYVGTLGGPLQKGKVWFFSSFEYAHENASIAYSPDNRSQFNALASLAGQGLIPGVTSISVPSQVPVPFHDYLGTARLDWSQSRRSQWFIRGATDRYTTRNDLVQQATLPSTGAASRSNYLSLVVGNRYTFSTSWLGSLTFNASGLNRREARNSQLGFALAFPFSSTSRTISGFETFGDNQFVTPITAFPVYRKQEKYQVRYDLTHVSSGHEPRFGVDFIHEPVLSGALAGTAENLTVFPLNPTDYLADPQQFLADLVCGPTATDGTTCANNPTVNGGFSQNVQRLGLYAEDSWRITNHLTINYGLRYDTTFGLFIASGRTQLENPALLTLQALEIPLVSSAPHDYRGALAPRLGIAYAPGGNRSTVLRAGFGLYYNDLAQNGWVTALQAVNAPPGKCAMPGDSGCVPGSAAGGVAALIDPNYKTPYAIHASVGLAHAFGPHWTLSADWTHEQGVHSYRRYQYQAGYTLFSPLFSGTPDVQLTSVPDLSLFRSDNRSSYDGLSIHAQGNVSRRLNLIVNYTLASAKTWGCVLGELSDYVNGVCNPLNAFGPGDYGPSGEDIRHRLVLAGIFYLPGGFEISTLSQAESARPYTMTTPVDVNGLGDALDDRAVVNGVQTRLDQFRGAPYVQIDLRVSRPFSFHEHWAATPFVEFFNLLNRNNPGANYVTDLSALPLPVNSFSNATAFCLNASCSATEPITSLHQLRVPAGALGDFFGPGTTVGISFAAQMGFRLTF
jgi:Carboxypeptidase regulatory-like domain